MQLTEQPPRPLWPGNSFAFRAEACGQHKRIHKYSTSRNRAWEVSAMGYSPTCVLAIGNDLQGQNFVGRGVEVIHGFKWLTNEGLADLCVDWHVHIRRLHVWQQRQFQGHIFATWNSEHRKYLFKYFRRRGAFGNFQCQRRRSASASQKARLDREFDVEGEAIQVYFGREHWSGSFGKHYSPVPTIDPDP